MKHEVMGFLHDLYITMPLIAENIYFRSFIFDKRKYIFIFLVIKINYFKMYKQCL